MCFGDTTKQVGGHPFQALAEAFAIDHAVLESACGSGSAQWESFPWNPTDVPLLEGLPLVSWAAPSFALGPQIHLHSQTQTPLSTSTQTSANAQPFIQTQAQSHAGLLWSLTDPFLADPIDLTAAHTLLDPTSTGLPQTQRVIYPQTQSQPQVQAQAQTYPQSLSLGDPARFYAQLFPLHFPHHSQIQLQLPQPQTDAAAVYPMMPSSLALDSPAPRVVFQPIVDLRDGFPAAKQKSAKAENKHSPKTCLDSEQPSASHSSHSSSGDATDMATRSRCLAVPIKKYSKSKEASRKARQRKKAYIQRLEEQMRTLQEQRESFQQQLITLDVENRLLRDQLADLKGVIVQRNSAPAKWPHSSLVSDPRFGLVVM